MKLTQIVSKKIIKNSQINIKNNKDLKVDIYKNIEEYIQIKNLKY